MNNDSNNPDKPRKKREPHKGDKARFTPSVPGTRWNIPYYSYSLREIIKQNLNSYRFSYYQAAILRILYFNNKDDPKMYMNEYGLLIETQKYFNLLNYPKKAKKKSVQSAISVLNKKNQIIADYANYNTEKGEKTLLGYHIGKITDEMKKQIITIGELINKNQNKNKP